MTIRGALLVGLLATSTMRERTVTITSGPFSFASWNDCDWVRHECTDARDILGDTGDGLMVSGRVSLTSSAVPEPATSLLLAPDRRGVLASVRRKRTQVIFPFASMKGAGRGSTWHESNGASRLCPFARDVAATVLARYSTEV